jgi:cobalt/nickel transport system permease protein
VHLADGIVSNPALLAGLGLIGGAGFVSAARRSLRADARTVAWTGTLGAFALAVQALNVPLLPGASAHAIGAGLLTMALGPARAIVALGAVLIVQALLLADGGITALGVNLLNLAVLPALIVHSSRVLLAPRLGLPIAAAIGTALGTVAGASSLALTLVLGAAAPLALTFGWLVGVQALAGLAEGVITAMIVRRLVGSAPALLEGSEHGSPASSEPWRGLRWAALAIALTVLLIPLASSQPDALESVIERLRAEP